MYNLEYSIFKLKKIDFYKYYNIIIIMLYYEIIYR